MRWFPLVEACLDVCPKHQEILRRGFSQRYTIEGPVTRKPTDFKLFLGNEGNKTQLCQYKKIPNQKLFCGKEHCKTVNAHLRMCKHLSIISDNGLEFINSWSKTVYKLLGVKSIRTSVYKPTTNSQCERTNRSINSILRKFVCDNPKNLSNNLCYVTYVINTSMSESTKASPFSLI